MGGGYSKRFGLVHVDFDTLARTPKASYALAAGPDREQRCRAGPAMTAPAATVEPTVPVTGRWIFLLSLANLAVWMGFFTPIQVLLPEQLQAIAPENKEAMLGWVTGLGALAAVIANPLAGALSDRTAGRFGRRHPWTLARRPHRRGRAGVALEPADGARGRVVLGRRTGVLQRNVGRTHRRRA